MSREAFTVPTGATVIQTPGSQNQQRTGEDDPTTNNPIFPYVCSGCGAKVLIKEGRDAIRCKECGYRVLQKARTTRMVQFEAR